MRIIETVFPIKVPQQPRVFTLEVTEDELDDILVALSDVFDRDEEEMIAQIETALS